MRLSESMRNLADGRSGGSHAGYASSAWPIGSSPTGQLSPGRPLEGFVGPLHCNWCPVRKRVDLHVRACAPRACHTYGPSSVRHCRICTRMVDSDMRTRPAVVGHSAQSPPFILRSTSSSKSYGNFTPAYEDLQIQSATQFHSSPKLLIKLSFNPRSKNLEDRARQ